MACSQKVDLVSPDYYEQELKFQGQIDRVERTRRAASQAAVAYDAAGAVHHRLAAGRPGRARSQRAH